MFLRIIRIGIVLIITILGACLGNLLNAPQNNIVIIYWVIFVFLLIFIIEFYFSKNDELTTEIQDLRDKLTRLLILKKTEGIQCYNISLYPSFQFDEFRSDNFQYLNIYITAPFSLTEFPDLEIKTEQKFEIKINGTIIESNYHANKYVYLINHSFLKQPVISNKFFCYELNIKPTFHGLSNFEFIAEGNNLKSTVQQKFKSI